MADVRRLMRGDGIAKRRMLMSVIRTAVALMTAVVLVGVAGSV
jgi:hypothetical protein